jgi:hypothetical protein
MHLPSRPAAKAYLSLAVLLLSTTALPACSVNKSSDGESDKVDIKTPVGSVHVSKDAEQKEIGLPVYPGAHPKEKEEKGEQSNANLSIATGAFGLKVVAIEYESDDPPQKILSYYSEELKKFGKVIECQSSGVSASLNSDSNDDGLTCEDSKGPGTELKVGNKANQHLVSVKPRGSGSDFALVYIRTRGKDTI